MEPGLGLYFLIGISLGFVIRAFYRTLELKALEKQAREHEAARHRRIDVLYGRSKNEE